MTEILEKVFLYTHLFGFAAVAGGLLYQLPAKSRRIGSVILNGARWQVVSGIILYILILSQANHFALGIKIIIALVILTLAEINRKKDKISVKLYYFLLLLVLIQVVFALFAEKA